MDDFDKALMYMHEFSPFTNREMDIIRKFASAYDKVKQSNKHPSQCGKVNNTSTKA